MEPSQWTARRATLEDLPALEALWQRCGLPWEQLEKFFTEFQVVTKEEEEGEESAIHAALGLLVEGAEGLVHTEAIPPSDIDPDELRAVLWRRLQLVARNQGVQRLWTQEDAPYWVASGFSAPSPKTRAETHASFLDSDPGWKLFQLMDPDKASKLVQEQLAIWQASREQESGEFLRTISTVRNAAFIITGVIIAVLIGMATYIFLRRPDLMQQLLRR